MHNPPSCLSRICEGLPPLRLASSQRHKLLDDPQVKDDLLSLCSQVAANVRSLPPTISPADVANELSSISASGMDWNKQDDIELRRRLGRLANEIDRMRRLKTGGVTAYTGELGDKMRTVLEQLRGHGLFLVPVGELEQWLADIEVGISKKNKRAWSNAAAHIIQTLGRQSGDVWDFVSTVGNYLMSAQADRRVPYKRE